MKIIATGKKRKYSIKKQNQILAELVYPKLFSSKASITLLNKHHINIVSKGIWSSKFAISKNDKERGELTFNWKGQTIIHLIKKSGKEKNWILKHKGFWGHRFELYNEADEKVIKISASLDWSTLKYKYEIECLSEKLINNEKLLIEILSYCVYGANLYMSRKANAVG